MIRRRESRQERSGQENSRQASRHTAAWSSTFLSTSSSWFSPFFPLKLLAFDASVSPTITLCFLHACPKSDRYSWQRETSMFCHVALDKSRRRRPTTGTWRDFEVIWRYSWGRGREHLMEFEWKHSRDRRKSDGWTRPKVKSKLRSATFAYCETYCKDKGSNQNCTCRPEQACIPTRANDSRNLVQWFVAHVLMHWFWLASTLSRQVRSAVAKRSSRACEHSLMSNDIAQSWSSACAANT